MKLQVVRTQLGKDATNGLLFIDGLFECYTLEDQYQAVKVMHETCIPEGTYQIKLRTIGTFDKRYKSKYPTFHRGMLWIQDVPGFEYILKSQSFFLGSHLPLHERLMTSLDGSISPSRILSITDLVILIASSVLPSRINSYILVIVVDCSWNESVLLTSYPLTSISSRGHTTRPTYLFFAP